MKPSGGTDTNTCPLCGHAGEFVEQTKILEYHEANLIRCSQCFTCWFQQPHWLEEAYEETLTSSDVGLVSRNAIILKGVVFYLRVCRPRFRESILDFGAGTGLLVRSLRDAGYDARYFDHYGGNLFAKGHEAALDGRYGLATAIEVLEHVVDVRSTLEGLLNGATELLFTTELIDPQPPAFRSWPYYGLDHGQHIQFFSARGLSEFARSQGMFFVSSGGIHLITPSRRRARMFSAAMRIHGARIRLRFRSRRSLLWTDVAASG